jgi:hypothetical protein
MRARSEKFPLAAGDITDHNSKLALFLYCPDCCAAKSQWLSENE